MLVVRGVRWRQAMVASGDVPSCPQLPNLDIVLTRKVRINDSGTADRRERIERDVVIGVASLGNA